MSSDKKKKAVKKPVRRDWEGFLLCRKPVGTEELSQALSEAGIRHDSWHGMQMMEVSVAEATSVDVELSSVSWEGEDQIFLENHDIVRVFELTVPEDGLAAALKTFEAFAKAGSGVVCSDTEDFQPVLAGNL